MDWARAEIPGVGKGLIFSFESFPQHAILTQSITKSMFGFAETLLPR